MTSPALGICWQFWRRTRWGVFAVAGYLLLTILVQRFVPMGAERQDDAGMMGIPLIWVACAALSIFTYGHSELDSRESRFPKHSMVLPATSSALVLWPMVCGALAVGALWMATVLVILRPCGVGDAPLVWPAVWLGACIAWMNALAVWPFGLRFARLAAAGLVMAALMTGLVKSHHAEFSEPAIAACFGATIPLAYVVGRAGLRRARRGDGTVWKFLAPLARFRGADSGAQPPFRSALAAQQWWELTRNILTVPIQVALVCAALWIAAFVWRFHPIDRPIFFGGATPSAFALLSGVALLLPPLMACTMGSLLGKPDAWGRELCMGSFHCVRPISCTDIVAAKFRAAWVVTALSWLVAFASIAGWALLLPGECVETLGFVISDARRAAGAVFVVLLLIAGTWRLMTAGAWISLGGRSWIAAVVPQAIIYLVAGLGFLTEWLLAEPDRRQWTLNAAGAALPWALLLLMAIKLSLAVVLARRLCRRGLLDRTRVTRWLTIWLAVLVVLFGAATGTLRPPAPRLLHLLAFCVLAVPFARLAAAPLMLHWNRHR